MIHFLTRCEGGGRGGRIRHGKISRSIPDQGEVREPIDGEAMFRASFVEPRRGEVARDHAVADKKDDPERLRCNDLTEISDSDGHKYQQAEKGEQLMAKFHG